VLAQSGEQPSAISKLPLSSLRSKVERREDEELLLSDRPEEGSNQTITIRKEVIQFKKRIPEDKGDNFRQIFHDESSRELDDKINQLEREIEKEGGKISVGKD
jgi:uncharacterized protein YaaR (DUF327 family)